MINDFTCKTFKTRGGRLGSGMGLLLEALWVYFMNEVLSNEGGDVRLCELVWLPDHQPADFACVIRGANWQPETKVGELLRIEAKSMNTGVDEAKGHFTNLLSETSEHDQLLVIVWSWEKTENQYVWPRINDYFIGSSRDIINMRDQLHVARKGSFVQPGHCPDGCHTNNCTHTGEPLNAAGKRERRTGPASCRPPNVDYAANFGGLLRMIKTSSKNASTVFREARRNCYTCHSFISFIHNHYKNEELSQYTLSEWRSLGDLYGLDFSTLSKADIQSVLISGKLAYKETLRDNFK